MLEVIDFFVDSLYKLLYNKSITNRTSEVRSIVVPKFELKILKKRLKPGKIEGVLNVGTKQPWVDLINSGGLFGVRAAMR